MTEPQRLPLSILTDIVRAPDEEIEAIPMLTDVVPLPKNDVVPIQKYSSAALPEAVTELDWSGIEHRVREQVMTQLSSSANALLEKKMNSLMTVVLNRHVEALRSELQLMLAQSLRDIVTEAVQIELTALQGEIDKSRRR
jgi:hypothetical protein